MALTLRQLASAEGLPVLAGSAGLDRTVGWVHPTELLDPTAFLDGGELLLTTGLALDSAFDAYVERLVAAGVAGIGFGSGLSHARVPAALVAAAEAAGLPLLEVPHDTPFIAITKAVSAAVAADEYATVVRTGRGQQDLTRAAVGRGGPAAVVRRLARLVDGWVLLLDSGTPVEAVPASARAYAAELRVADLRGTRGARVSTGDEVVLHSLDARTVLAVGRASALDTADQFIVNTAASLLSLALQRNREQSGVLARLRSGLLELWLSDVDFAVPVIRGLWPSLPAPPWQVVVVVGAPAGRRAFVDAAADLFCVARDSDVVVISDSAESFKPLIRRLGLNAGISAAYAPTATVSTASDSTAPAAVGTAPAAPAAAPARVMPAPVSPAPAEVDSATAAPVSPDPAEANSATAAPGATDAAARGPAATESAARASAATDSAKVGPAMLAPAAVDPATALRQAEQAAAAARGRGVAWLEFAEYAGSGLLSLLPSESTALFADALLSSLSSELIEALRCWLEEHGHYDTAATRLGIHRHTLRNRLRKAESLLGRDLSSPGTRAELWIALLFNNPQSW